METDEYKSGLDGQESYDAECEDCGKSIQAIGKPEYCCSGRDCGCMGKDQRQHVCDLCKWKAEFDKGKLNLVVDGVDTKDYPDFCDAYTSPDSTYNGEPLEDWQIEWIDENYPELVNEAAFEKYIY